MIDIHTHILPGIDDGAKDMADTLRMVRMAADSGVTVMTATSHCNIPGSYGNYAGEEYKNLFWRVSEEVKREGIPVQILPGAEVFATYDLPELLRDEKVFTLNGSRYLLIEFAFDEDPGFAQDVLNRMREMRVRPLIAHAERYEFVQEIPQIVYEWRENGCLIQINKGSFQGRFGRRAKAAAEFMMQEKLVAVIASDAHSPYHRTPYMKDVYDQLLREYPERYLKVLFEGNPRRILKNQPTIRFTSREN